MTKPFIKWVGGKTQIMAQILDRIPSKMDTYYELFLGGGSVLINLLESEHHQANEYRVYDVNEHLIQCYRDIQTHPDELVKELERIVQVFNTSPEYVPKPHVKIHNCTDCLRDKKCKKCRKPRNIIPVLKTLEEASRSRAHVYYFVRNEFNRLMKQVNLTRSQTITKSAYFIFINKTCWRGLYRESTNGFNVPYGNYKNPQIYDPENIQNLHRLFTTHSVYFEVANFRELSLDVSNTDFIYMDPPYYPINDKSFTRYTEKDFSLSDHEALVELCLDLKCRFLLSNSYTEWTLDKFSRWNIEQLNCKRSIHSKEPDTKVLEILVSKIEME